MYNSRDMNVFKYMGKNRLNDATLVKEGVWICFSKPETFNDAFECTGCFLNLPTDDFVDDYFKKVPYAYESSIAHYWFRDRQTPPSYIAERLQMEFWNRKFVGRNLWIGCFADEDALRSDPGADALMWAHYASNSTGFRLTIDLDGLFDVAPDYVTYSKTPPVQDLSKLDAIRDLEGFVNKCLTTKQESWRYEHERRIILNSSTELTLKLEKRYINDNKGMLVLIPLKHIKMLTLGYEAFHDQELRDRFYAEANRLIQLGWSPSIFNIANRNHNIYGFSDTALPRNNILLDRQE